MIFPTGHCGARAAALIDREVAQPAVPQHAKQDAGRTGRAWLTLGAITVSAVAQLDPFESAQPRLNGRIYENSDQRRQALPAWTHFYNWHRPHHGINLTPPVSRLSVPRKNLLTLHS